MQRVQYSSPLNTPGYVFIKLDKIYKLEFVSNTIKPLKIFYQKPKKQ